MKRFLVIISAILAIVLALSAGAEGYIVILRNGEHLRCREPMTIEGKNAILTLVTGQVASLALDKIDLIETERFNKLGLGDAYIIEELTVESDIPPTPTPRPKLGSYASISDPGANPELGNAAPPTPTPTPGIKLQVNAYPDARVDAAFTEILDKKNLYLYRTSIGTQPGYYFIQAVTDTQREVFHALETVAEAYSMIASRNAEIAPEAVELRMVQTSGKIAGTFRLTVDMAHMLEKGEIEPERFYVENVIF